MNNDLYVIIGAYGSGKSEYSINMANRLNKQGKKVTLVDLDVVNPYFRSRDVKEKFEEIGIEVISPEGQYRHADLPMLSPRIKGAVQNYDRDVILDVGGDPMGCRTLARYFQDINKRGYKMIMVINTKRPFTSNVEEIEIMITQLEETSNLKISELICNSNLLKDTTIDVIKSGIEIIKEIAYKRKIKFDKFLILDEIEANIPNIINGISKNVMEYFLNKPWEMLIMKGI